MKHTTIIMGSGLAMALSTPAFAGKDVSIEDVPAPVRNTIKQQVGDGFLEDIELDDMAGRTVYEVEIIQSDGKEFELEIAEDGKVLSRVPD